MSIRDPLQGIILLNNLRVLKQKQMVFRVYVVNGGDPVHHSVFVEGVSLLKAHLELLTKVLDEVCQVFPNIISHS